MIRGETREVMFDSDGVLRIGSCISIPKVGDLIRLILEEAHYFRYSIHPKEVEMYHDLIQHYWLPGMNRDVSKFISRCLTYQQVKSEHLRLGGEL